MDTQAIVIDKPLSLGLQTLGLAPAGAADVVVETIWSGISTGTEKLFWNGTMPSFPGMGYPLVPGYEAVGRIVDAHDASGRRVGDMVFVPGAHCFEGANGLFGASAARLVVSGGRTIVVPEDLGEDATLLALAATAHHALALPHTDLPDLVIGNGVLGRLIVRLAVALGAPPPTVWERDPRRRNGAEAARVIDATEDEGRGYRAIVDVSGDPSILDTAIRRLAPKGTITLAGFYAAPLAFAFPPAFMREASIRISAEFEPVDIAAVVSLISHGRLRLDGLVTHRAASADARAAYETAFTDPCCLKMVLDWRSLS